MTGQITCQAFGISICCNNLFILFTKKTYKMKSIKMLMMAALTILSVSVFAQDTAKHKMKMPAHQSGKMKYSCPMHPEVTSDKPGKCSKCGMKLTVPVLEKKEENK